VVRSSLTYSSQVKSSLPDQAVEFESPGLATILKTRITARIPSMVMTDNPQKSRVNERIYWPVFGPVSALGLLLVGAALGMSIIYDWSGIWIDFFLTFGATILLGAVLYVIQGSFLTTVQEQADRVIENVATQAAALEERIQTQERRIETLSSEVAGDRREREEAADQALAAITDEMTYEAVSSALRKADRSTAISTAFRVPASRDLGAMHVYLNNTVLMDRIAGGSPRISIRPWFPDGRQVQQDEWLPGEDVRAMIARIDEKIGQANLVPADTWDPTMMFGNLRNSLEMFATPHRGSSPRPLNGALIELLNDDWILTEAGLESLRRDVGISIDDFPGHVARMAGAEYTPPPAPPGVDRGTWRQLVEVARATYAAHPKNSFFRPKAYRM
jgi:hypothetical protein